MDLSLFYRDDKGQSITVTPSEIPSVDNKALKKSLPVQALLNRALNRNFVLKTLESQREQARQTIRLGKNDYLPKVDLAYEWSQDRGQGSTTLAQEEGLTVRDRNITRDQLYLADEAFFTGTAVEVTPVVEVDDRSVGDGKVGPITKRLQDRYFDVVKGTDDTHPEWLTVI